MGKNDQSEKYASEQQKQSLSFFPGEKNKGWPSEAIAQVSEEKRQSLPDSHLIDEGESFHNDRVSRPLDAESERQWSFSFFVQEKGVSYMLFWVFIL